MAVDGRTASSQFDPAHDAPEPAPLFGRERERELLARLLADARQGRGRLALLSGAAGIGKTALLDDLERVASADGCLLLTGRCYDLSTTPPYGPWLEIIRASPHLDGRPALGELIGRGDDDSAVRRAGDLFTWARDLFVARAERAPLVLVLDDLHWSDEASLDALRRIAREIATHPILLVAAYRDDELTRRQPLYELIPLLVREARAERINLRALDDEDLRAWVRSRLRFTSADEQRLVTYLARYSDGIPLFAGELLRSVEADHVTVDARGQARLGALEGAAVPLLLRQILDRWISRATPETRELLAVAAVIGPRIAHELWAGVAEAEQAALERAVHEAVECGLLVSDVRRPELAFRHALIRELLYQDMLPHRRQLWHRRVAERLLMDDAPDPDEVAHHLRLAGDPRAIEWLTRAGERAHRRAYAFQTAARRYEAALELAGTRHELLPARGWLLARLASVLRFADPGQGVVLLTDAEEIGRRVGDDALAGMAVWMRGTLRFLAGENGLADAIAGDAALDELADSELQRIRESLGGRLPDRVARRAGLVWWHGYHGRPADAFELADWVDAHIGESHRLDIDRAVCEAGRAFALAARGRLSAARAAFQESRRLLEEHAYAFHVTTVTAFEFYLLDLPYFTTDLRERRRKHELLQTFANQGLQDLVPLPPEVPVCTHLLIEGRWHALGGLFDALRAAPRSFFSWNYAVPTLASYARHTGDPDTARELVRLMLPQGPHTDVGATGAPARSLEALRLGCELALDDGDLPAALEWLAAHDRWLAWSDYLLGRAEGMLLRARYSLLAGDAAASRDAADQALALASQPPQPLAQLAAHRFLMELETDAGQLDSARAHFGEALALADACAAPFERALTQLSGARLELAARQREAGRRMLDEVIETCLPLGARPALDEARRLLADAGRRGREGVLSPRELEVIALVVDGLTDREVAERLFISTRTVNQHVRSIYNKLGVSSRAAATRRALELGIL